MPARAKIAGAAARSLPKMHWSWRSRGRDILALLHSRFGSSLPDDDAGMDAAKLLAQHYMGLKTDAERVTRENLRIWARWLTLEAMAGIIKDAAKAKRPSAAQLGRDYRVTVDEVADLSLSSIAPLTVTQEGDRDRQDRQRRKEGASRRRGRPPLKLSDIARKARSNDQAAERMRKMRALRKNSHAPSYIRGMERDELSVTPCDARGPRA